MSGPIGAIATGSGCVSRIRAMSATAPSGRASLGDGSSWVEPLLNNLADIYKKMPQDFEEDPIAVFKRNVHVSPFWEEDLGALAGLIGEDHVLFGSDYPHPEGLADPASYVEELQSVSDDVVRKIMGGNLARLMNTADTVLA